MRHCGPIAFCCSYISSVDSVVIESGPCMTSILLTSEVMLYLSFIVIVSLPLHHRSKNTHSHHQEPSIMLLIVRINAHDGDDRYPIVESRFRHRSVRRASSVRCTMGPKSGMEVVDGRSSLERRGDCWNLLGECRV